jgi:hypothetical protein
MVVIIMEYSRLLWFRCTPSGISDWFWRTCKKHIRKLEFWDIMFWWIIAVAVPHGIIAWNASMDWNSMFPVASSGGLIRFNGLLYPKGQVASTASYRQCYLDSFSLLCILL